MTVTTGPTHPPAKVHHGVLCLEALEPLPGGRSVVDAQTPRGVLCEQGWGAAVPKCSSVPFQRGKADGVAAKTQGRQLVQSDKRRCRTGAEETTTLRSVCLFLCCGIAQTAARSRES